MEKIFNIVKKWISDKSVTSCTYNITGNNTIFYNIIIDSRLLQLEIFLYTKEFITDVYIYEENECIKAFTSDLESCLFLLGDK